MTGISWITVIWSMGAAASLTLAVTYFFVWVKNRARAHLLFVMTATSFAVYAFFELRVMFAQTPQQLDTALRWVQIPLSLGLVSLIAFVWAYLKAGRPWFVWSIAGIRTIYVLPSLLMGGNPILEIRSLQHMQFLGESVTLNKGVPTTWGLIGLLTVLLILVFVVDASLTAWRRGDRRKALIVGGSTVFFLVVAFATGTLITWSDLKIPLANSLYYLGLVAVMGYELSRDVLRASQLADDLIESQQRYALATAAGAVGVWDWNLKTNEIYVDPTLKSILGFDDTEIPNRIDDWGSRVYAEDVPAVMAQAQRCISGEIDIYEIAHRMVHKDGSLRWFLARGSLVNGKGSPKRLVGTDTDITERKQAEELIRENQAVLQASHREIHDLAGRLIVSQEVERARLARDLHDDFSQQIAGLSIALSGLKRRVSAMPGAGELPGEVGALQQRAIGLAENIRNLSHDLHPSALEHAGLVAALGAYCADLAREQPLSIAFTADGDLDSTSTAAALCLYRVAQEGLRNVVTHARATHAELRLQRLGDQVELTIVDDGTGFDITTAGQRGLGLGLVSINERVRLVGGTLSIVTELNKGTRVRVQIPANGRATNAGSD